MALMLVFCLSPVVEAKRQAPEREYQENWCNSAVEVRLSDGSRVDCLTPHWAIEIDFANKWAECIGQALHYAAMTRKKPACALIIESEKDCRHVTRLKSAITAMGKEGFKYWLIGGAAESCQKQ